ncbi:MAG: hypothetical protein JO033_04780 [Acidobacteriaceae bacterium]|nr:hypothetical protein [Acidobacteriaceae bacterium]MBV9179864.1 hypothetical protein [Acidobacteriota bacterium]
MSLFSKIENFVHGAEVKVSADFEKLVGKERAQQFAQSALALLKTAEGKVVADAVEAVSTLATDGAGKRVAAVQKIGTDLKAQGITVAESLLNLLVELAVQALKGYFAAA